MGFLRHEEIYRSDEEARSGGWAAPGAHRFDEFPAGYSLAGCSPAEPASASPAGYSIGEKAGVGNLFPANGNLSPFTLSHDRGAAQGLPVLSGSGKVGEKSERKSRKSREKSGTGYDFFLLAAAAAAFLGRPVRCGFSLRPNVASNRFTNPSLPSGRPVSVARRRAAISAASSSRVRPNASRQSSPRVTSFQSSKSNKPSCSRPSTCARALDHSYAGASSTIPARTGFRST